MYHIAVIEQYHISQITSYYQSQIAGNTLEHKRKTSFECLHCFNVYTGCVIRRTGLSICFVLSNLNIYKLNISHVVRSDYPTTRTGSPCTWQGGSGTQFFQSTLLLESNDESRAHGHPARSTCIYMYPRACMFGTRKYASNKSPVCPKLLLDPFTDLYGQTEPHGPKLDPFYSVGLVLDSY